MQWLRAAPQDQLFLSAVSIAELVRGIAQKRDPIQRARLETWFALSIRKWFEKESLAVTDTIAERAGNLIGQGDLAGRPFALADALIAATALEYDLTVVTRNTRDFTNLSVRLINPWEAPNSF